MKLNKKKLLLNVLSLASLIAVVSSCGNKKPDGPVGGDDSDVALDKLKISNFIYYIPNFARISFPFFD